MSNTLRSVQVVQSSGPLHEELTSTTPQRTTEQCSGEHPRSTPATTVHTRICGHDMIGGSSSSRAFGGLTPLPLECHVHSQDDMTTRSLEVLEEKVDETSMLTFLAFRHTVSIEDQVYFQHRVNASLTLEEAPYTPNQYTELRLIDDPGHPAYGQFGLFAKKKIPRDTIVSPYTGIIQFPLATPSSHTYVMDFDSKHVTGGSENHQLEIDSEYFGCYARFANDPRGVTWFYDRSDSGSSSSSSSSESDSAPKAEKKKKPTARRRRLIEEPATSNVVAMERTSRYGERYTSLTAKVTINQGDEILYYYGATHNFVSQSLQDLDSAPLSRPRRVGPSILSGEGHVVAESGAPVTAGAAGVNNKKEDDDAGQPTSAIADSSRLTVLLEFECVSCGHWSRMLGKPLIVHRCASCHEPKANMTRLRYGGSESRSAMDTESKDQCISGTIDLAGEGCSSSERDATAAALAASDAAALNTAIAATSATAAGSSKISLKKKDGGSPFVVAPGGGAPPRSGSAGGTNTDVNHWPLNFPFQSWQIWDPRVTVSRRNLNRELHTQNDISLTEYARKITGVNGTKGGLDKKRKGVIAIGRSYKAGEEIGYAGGVLCPPSDPWIQCQLKDRLPRIDFQGDGWNPEEGDEENVAYADDGALSSEDLDVEDLEAQVLANFDECLFLEMPTVAPVIEAGATVDTTTVGDLQLPTLVCRPIRTINRVSEILTATTKACGVDSHRGPRGELPLIMAVTNEIQNIRIISERCGSGDSTSPYRNSNHSNNTATRGHPGGNVQVHHAPNVVLKLFRDPLGAFYVRVEALKDLPQGTEMVLGGDPLF